MIAVKVAGLFFFLWFLLHNYYLQSIIIMRNGGKYPPLSQTFIDSIMQYKTRLCFYKPLPFVPSLSLK